MSGDGVTDPRAVGKMQPKLALFFTEFTWKLFVRLVRLARKDAISSGDSGI